MSDSGSTGQLIRYKKLRLAFSRFRKSKIDAQAGQTGVPIDQRQIDPEGNQRWHLESCRDPDVVGEKDGDIFCRKCKRSPNISKLIAKHNRQHTSGLTVPPDEPYGQYGLWWPRTIPYTKKPSSGDLNEPSGESGKLEPTKDSDKGASKPSDHTITRPETSLYQKRLASNEFRLLCLPPLADGKVDAPLHITLETHNDERYAEYETVSYTWGGEEDDASLCQPIFVGPYWDVLLQTKNCWDMLQFLRPSRFHRLLWVDAICINQSDNLERGAQVAKMGFIYKNGTRTVVWLGKDISSSPPTDYPLRRGLNEVCTLGTGEKLFEANGKVNLRKLLQRRYFSRVWVIQELLLSRRLLIPIGETEILVDAPSVGAISGWQQTAAPWMEFSTKGRYLDLNIFQLMVATSDSQATDRRDKLYGLLGLTKCTAFVDYTISSIHSLIGIAAHYLLDLHRPDLLLQAHGHKAAGLSPSWMIDVAQVASSGHWSNGQYIYSTEYMAEIVKDFRRRWQEDSQGGSEERVADRRMLEPLRLVEVNSRTPPRDWREDASKTSLFWYDNAMVDQATAALSINLTHLCTIGGPLVPYSAFGEIRSYSVSSHSESRASGCGNMFILSLHWDLDEIIKPYDEIFILDKADSVVPIFLVLRPKKDLGDKAFTLVICCDRILFEFRDTSSWRFRETEIWRYRNAISIVELRRSLAEFLDDMKASFAESKADPARVLPGIESTGGFLNAIAHRHLDADDFLEVCLENIDDRFKPAQVDCGLWLCISQREWDDGSDKKRIDGGSIWDLCSHWRYLEGEKWIPKSTRPKLKQQIYMRFNEEDLKARLENDAEVTPYVEAVGKLEHAIWATGGKRPWEILELSETQPDQFKNTGCPRWPYDIIEAFKITGNTYQVTIY
ncbi:heterokaryon incompatibility protein-domain-containing protein [Cladorrhinum samala]|uniref:Heterokaryon incompatibility protein-domain-containing protein n=1 Tax=Cladorrhinum samala TaxID=585594 RepID=A0AAV9HJQ1_9PEZI|nr:heterokaryon incompatibility protein-domain-containing protein [Cladorrhinum samala]